MTVNPLILEDKRILITGGAGFIGSHLADRLAPKNEVTILDIRLDNCLKFSPLASDPRVRKLQGDVRDPEIVTGEVQRADIVIHLASLIGVKYVIDHARETIDTVLLGTRNVLEASRRQGKLLRLLNVSTSEIYGDAVQAEEGGYASVPTANDPRASYASSKLMGEHLVWAYHRDFGIPAVNVRPFNIYGPRRLTSNAISLFIVKALAGKELTLYGGGSQLRSWCYIDDFCTGILACLSRPEAVGHDFNLGNPVTACTIYDLAKRIVRLCNSPSQVTAAGLTFTDIGARACSSAKAQELLGFRANCDLDDGLLNTIAWHRDHTNHFTHWL